MACWEIVRLIRESASFWRSYRSFPSFQLLPSSGNLEIAGKSTDCLASQPLNGISCNSNTQTHGRNNAPAPNATASADGSVQNKLLDDEEDPIKARKAKQAKLLKDGRPLPNRQRSSSLSNPSSKAAKQFGVFETSRAEEDQTALPRSTPYSYTQEDLQARYATRQAFSQRKAPQLLLTLPGASLQIARPITSSTARSSPLVKSQTRPSTPSRSVKSVRRNSTSAVETSSTPLTDVPPEVLQTSKPPQEEQPEAAASSVEVSTDAPLTDQPVAQSSSPAHIMGYPPSLPSFAQQPSGNDAPFAQYVKVVTAHQDLSRLRTFTQLYRQHPEGFTSSRHGHLMGALNDQHAYADVSAEISALWDDFSKHDMVPDKYAHGAIIAMLARRSQTTDRLLKNQQLRNNAAKLGGAAEQWSQGLLYDLSGPAGDASTDSMHSEASLAALKQQTDEDYASARKLLFSLGQEGREISGKTLRTFLAAASTRGDIDAALTAFGFLERGPGVGHSRADAQCFKYLLLTYVKAGEKQGAQTVFSAFKRGKGRIDTRRPDYAALLDSEEVTSEAAQTGGEGYLPRDSDIHVWNAMVYGNVMFGEGPSALQLLEDMMTPSKKAAPEPDNLTLLSLIQGFSESGDLESAFRWASKIHATPAPADLPQPPPRLEDTLNTIIAAAPTASNADIGKIQDAANLTPLLAGLGFHVRLLAGTATPSVKQTSETSPSSISPIPSPSSSQAQSSFDLGSVFSDPTVRSQTMSITPPPLLQNLVPEAETVQLDLVLSMKLDDMYKTSMDPIAIYGIVKSARRDGVHAYPETLGRLIEKLATVNAVTELEDLYLIAYNNLRSLPTQAEQTSSWAYLEDRMLIAMAKLGELGKAAMHRDRLLEAGAAPSADSYAAMITSAKDTTDDATVALELFEEARRFGVVPNLFLFNILISKLSRARRTHLALSYFEQMKSIGLRPSAVTYGSVIAACCRTGDEKAATFLFNEMTRSPGFRPRVPPYNTMMQFFVNTQPNREKALMYFDAMLRAKVAPTAHTYKLLLDAYGSIQPGARPF